MDAKTCNLDGVLVLTPRRHSDSRGYFSETWNRKTLANVGIDFEFVQDNHSFSAQAGTFRGFHYQRPPHQQAKLVRVVRGRILDVVLDLRRGSTTYGHHFSVELSAETGNQIFVPPGFSHGFLTLMPECEVLYKSSDYYEPKAEGGVRFDDPGIQVEWPLPVRDFLTNDRDRTWPTLADVDTPF